MIKIISIALLLLVSGCSIKDVSKPVKKYTIEDNSKVVIQSTQIDKVLKIAKLKSSKYLQSENIWYKKSSNEVNAYIYSRWNEGFTHMVEKNIASTIYRSGLFKSMYTRHSRMSSSIVLEGEMIDAKQVVDSENSAKTVFAIRLYLVDSTSSSIITSKEFTYEENYINMNAANTIVAFNNIVKKFNKDVVIWLKKSMM